MRLRIVSDESMLPKSKLIRFNLENRRLRLYPSGKFFARSHMNGQETKTGCIWKEVKFNEDKDGYYRCNFYIHGVQRNFSQHRLVYYAYNQDWNIFDISKDNIIDHKNRIKTDNTKENLHVVNHQQNCFNTNAKGYYWDPKKKRWRAEIMLDGKKHRLGRFKTEEEARNAYLKKKAEIHII